MNLERYHLLESSYIEHGGEHFNLFKKLAMPLSDIPFTACCVDLTTYEHDVIFSLNIGSYGEVVVVAPKNKWPKDAIFPWSFYINEDCVCNGILPIVSLVERCRNAAASIVPLLESMNDISKLLKQGELQTC